MKIRNAKDSDLIAITDLIITCSEKFILPDFSEEGVRHYIEDHSIDKMRERLQQFHYQVLVDSADRIIGVVGIRSPSHLFHLHIEPELQGQGLGRQLWESAKTIAISKERPSFFTVNSSLYAVPFYKKLGFQPKEKETKNGVIYVPMKMKVRKV